MEVAALPGPEKMGSARAVSQRSQCDKGGVNVESSRSGGHLAEGGLSLTLIGCVLHRRLPCFYVPVVSVMVTETLL